MLDSIPSEESVDNVELKINRIDSIEVASPKFISGLKTSRFDIKPVNAQAR
jgi:hypothetical protein